MTPAPLRDPPHDPGGKTRLAMLPGVTGDAAFSECGRFRHWLSRDWGDNQAAPYALWIGMNPSTAEADVDDPTIRREIEFTRRDGFTRYFKTNVMDYRATSPKRLLDEHPCSDQNRSIIRSLAVNAGKIIICHGKLHKKLRRYSDAVKLDLRGLDLWCLGRNNDGSPRHPLYLDADTPLERY